MKRKYLLTSIIALPFLSACSFSVGDSGIDSDKLKSEISTTLDAEYSKIGAKVDSVSCEDPGDDVEDGDEFGCTARVGDVDIHVQATVDGEDVRFVTTDRLISRPHLSEALTPLVTEKVGTVTVDCGTGYVARPANSTVDCAVSDPSGSSGDLVYYVTDDPQNDHWKLN